MDDLQAIMDKLDADEQQRLQTVLNTVAMQAELIADMSRDLMTFQGAAALQRDALRSVTLTSLAQKIQGQLQRGPTVGEISQAVTQMRTAIQAAQTGQEAFQSVFGFAMKVCPLFV